MKLIRENFIPTLIIIIAGVIVSLAILPLGNSQMAEEARSGETAELEEEAFAEDGAGALVGRIVGPLIKFSIFTGMGFVLVSLGSWITRMIQRLIRPSVEKP